MYSFLLFLLLFLFSSLHSIDHNPCAGQPQNCKDEKDQTGCSKLFPVPSVDCLDDSLQDFIDVCRKTCNRCCEDPKFGSCQDATADVCSFAACPFMPDFSFDNCRATCGLCEETEAICADKSTDCPRYESLCATDQQVLQGCPKTCKTCGVAIPTTTTLKTTVKTTTKKLTTTKKTCYDADEACPSWVKNGFCSNPDPALKQKYCAKSCGFC